MTIRKRFEIINKIIESDSTRPVVLIVSKLHMNLTELVSKSSKVFSFQMTLMLGVSIINSTFGLFEIYVLTKDVLSFEKTYYCICAIAVNACFLAAIFIMLVTSSFTMNESRRALNVSHVGIYKGMRIKNKNTMRRIQIFLLQVQHYNANISCGLFRLHWKAIMMVSCLNFSHIFNKCYLFICFSDLKCNFFIFDYFNPI